MNLFIRKANNTDVDILYNWINEREVRRNAFDSHLISYKEHVEWFRRMMSDNSQFQYILMKDEKPIGQIRLTIYESDAEIDYSISPGERGCGFGQEIIKLVIERAKYDFPTVKRLVARVKPSNIASYNCFVKNGFEEKYKQMEMSLADGRDKD